MKIEFLKHKDEEKQNKEINIPKIEDLFKNQEKEIVLYHNSVLKGKLTKAIESIDVSVDKIKSYSFAGRTVPAGEIKKTSAGTDKFPTIGIPQQSNDDDY